MTQQHGPAMIEAEKLSKFYGDFAAIRDVTFQIHQSEVVAFLGPNGAGKSTTMKLLTGYLAPSSGVARIAGHDMGRDRLAGSARLGYLPENGPLYSDMSPRSLLDFFADARGLFGAKAGTDRSCYRTLRLRQCDRQAYRQAIARVSPARRHGPGFAPRTGSADPRRADRRPGSKPNSRGPRDNPQTRPKQNHSAFHPHFTGGRSNGQPSAVHRRRPNSLRRPCQRTNPRRKIPR